MGQESVPAEAWPYESRPRRSRSRLQCGASARPAVPARANGHAAAAPAYRIDTPAGGRHRSAVEIGNFGNFPVLGGKHHGE